MKTWMRRISPLLLALVLLAGMFPVSAADTGFADVRPSDYFAQAVDWALEEGVTAGTSDTTFSPNDTVTRAQAVTFLWRAAGSPQPASAVSPFRDVADPGQYYYIPVLWAAQQGITGGVSADSFGPHLPLAYDQIFTFLCKAAGDSLAGGDWSSAAVSWAESAGLTDALTFTPGASCPRRDVIYCLWKQLSGEDVLPVQPEDPLQPEEPVPGDLEELQSALVNGFRSGFIYIDVHRYCLEPSVVRELALELADLDGENPYGITQVTCYTALNGLAAQVGVSYRSNSSTITQIFTEPTDLVKARAEEVVAQVITPGMSSYEKAKALHDYLVLHCEYDMRLYSKNLPLSAHAATGALLDGAAVCDGYAKAYQMLLELVGIPCELLSGSAGGSHAWNQVQIDGAWYHVDVTWDDPIPDREGYVRYDYFLKSDAQMRKDHSWTGGRACTSTQYDDADLPDTGEQEEQQQEEQTEQELQARLAPLFTACYEVLDALPYRTQAQLEAASDRELQEASYLKISLPDGPCSREDLYLFHDRLQEQLASRYPFLSVGAVDPDAPSISIFRTDVRQELERRKAIKEAEREAEKAREEAEKAQAEALKQAHIQAIKDRLVQAAAACTTLEQEIPLSGYTDYEIQLACVALNQSTYADGSIRLLAQSGGSVVIRNLRLREEQIDGYIQTIEDAVRAGESIVTFPLTDDSRKELYNEAADRVNENGFSVDGLLSGEDFRIAGRWTSDKDGSTTYNLSLSYRQ